MGLPSRLHLDAVNAYQIPTTERAGLLRLDVNEHPCGPGPEVLQAMLAALTPEHLATYPLYAPWHQAASRYFGVPPDQVTCTAGGDEAIKAIIEAFLLPGKVLLQLSPTFDMFAHWARLYGNPIADVRHLPDFTIDETGWLQALDALGDRLGMVALVSPNNPTGALASRHLIEETLRRTAVPVILDETYGEFAASHATDLLQSHSHLLIVRSFSKVHGLAGLRTGAVLGQAEVVADLRKVLNPYNVSRPAIAASLAIMERPQWTERWVAQVQQVRTVFVDFLTARGISVGPQNANFVLAHLGDRAAPVTAALARQGILVRDRSGSHPDLQGWVRIAIGTPAQMDRLQLALNPLLT